MFTEKLTKARVPWESNKTLQKSDRANEKHWFRRGREDQRVAETEHDTVTAKTTITWMDKCCSRLLFIFIKVVL